MPWRRLVVACVSVGAPLVVLAAQAGGPPASCSDPAAHFNSREQAALASGVPVVTLSHGSGREITIVAAVRSSVSADRLIAWNRHQEQLYSGAFAPVGGRFSSPPRIEDLNGLQLHADDLRDLRKCEPDDCGLKLAADEIVAVRSAIAGGGANWRQAGTEAFRRLLVARATNYQAPPVPGVESWLFWSKNVVSGAREVISITHIAIARGPRADAALVTGTQVYASHYLDASVSYVSISGVSPNRYLTYVRTAHVDVFGGPFGGIVRHFVKKRIRADAPALLESLRATLEAREPPPDDRSRVSLTSPPR